MKRVTPRSPGEADALGLLGLAHRAGLVVSGVGETRNALRAGELGLVIFADDASPAQLDKIRGLIRHRPVPVRWVTGRMELGRAIGGPPTAAAGVRRSGFVDRLSEGLAEAPPEAEPAMESTDSKDTRGSGNAGR